VTNDSARIHPDALEEAEAAIEWYAQRSRRAAELFLDELDRAIQEIVLRRFPFVIVFRETAAEVEIIAIAHGRRRPRYWQDRLG
jgi:plasmid stabilization system protein ParE